MHRLRIQRESSSRRLGLNVTPGTNTMNHPRNALLPKLLSGEILVAEAERLVEDAG